MEITSISHCAYHCDYHLVIVTKYRRKVFNEGIFAYFRIKLAEVTEHYPMVKIKEINHDTNHLHILISIPPTIGVGKMVGIIKQNTAKELKQKFPIIRKIYWGTESVWSDGYFVSTVGIDEDIIERYIVSQAKKIQGKPEQGLSKLIPRPSGRGKFIFQLDEINEHSWQFPFPVEWPQCPLEESDLSPQLSK